MECANVSALQQRIKELEEQLVQEKLRTSEAKQLSYNLIKGFGDHAKKHLFESEETITEAVNEIISLRNYIRDFVCKVGAHIVVSKTKLRKLINDKGEYYEVIEGMKRK